ncbi:MAG: DUF2079 domain-containing protein, partial [Chloroflexota bacterium]
MAASAVTEGDFMPYKINRLMVLVMGVLFFSVISWMTFRQYAVFHLHAPDVATFGQAIFQTGRGNFLFSTIINRSINAYHFTPFFAFLSPLLFIWEDLRILFIAQTVAISAAGFILYFFAERVAPKAAIWVAAAFFLNPALHEVSLNELRRVTFSMPFIMGGLWLIHSKRYGWATFLLMFALLTKEDVGILLFAAGLFVWLIQRQWQVGLAWMVLGFVWTAGVIFCVIPSFQPGSSGFTCTSSYPQLSYFADYDDPEQAGESFTGAFDADDIAGNILSNPLAVIGRAFDAEGRGALLRILLPVALLLPFLGWEWLIIALPTTGLLLISSYTQTHTLQDWYMAPLLPILFVAVLFGLKRIGDWREGIVPLVGSALILFAVIGHLQFGYAPFGGEYIPVRYELLPKHEQAALLLKEIPEEARVLSQDAFVNHLALRKEIYLYPFYDEKTPVDFMVMDASLRHYPFSTDEIGWDIANRIADPDISVWREVGSTYIFSLTGAHNPSRQAGKTLEDAILLEKYELAVTDGDGVYRSSANPEVLSGRSAGDQIRV